MSKTSGLIQFFLLNFTKSKNSLNSIYRFILGKAAINKDRMSLKITSAFGWHMLLGAVWKSLETSLLLDLGFPSSQLETLTS